MKIADKSKQNEKTCKNSRRNMEKNEFHHKVKLEAGLKTSNNIQNLPRRKSGALLGSLKRVGGRERSDYHAKEKNINKKYKKISKKQRKENSG